MARRTFHVCGSGRHVDTLRANDRRRPAAAGGPAIARAARAACEPLENRVLMSTAVYDEDFDSGSYSCGAFDLGSVSTIPATSDDYLGPFTTGGPRLTLPGQQVGRVLHVSFSVYVLNGWAGSSVGPGGDRFALAAGPLGAEATVLDTSFATAGSGSAQAYPRAYGGGTAAAGNQAAGTGLTLDGTGAANDDRYTLSFEVPVTTPDMVLWFQSPSLQSGSAAWGLDDVVVTSDPVRATAPSGGRALGGDAAGVPSAAPGVLSSGVRGADGAVAVPSAGLSSAGFGLPWTHAPSWTNAGGYAAAGGDNGNGWVLSAAPTIEQSGSAYVVRDGGLGARWFDEAGGVFTPRFHTLDKLTHDAGAAEYRLLDTAGTVTKFHDFTVAAALRGKLKSFASAGGATATVAYDGVGQLDYVTRGSGGSIELFDYTYASGRISLVEQKRNGVAFRKIAYTYYGAAENHGNAGDLKFAVLQDGAGNEIDRHYYRYYVPGDADIGDGYVGGLKMAFGPQGWARLVGAHASGTDFDAVADGSVSTAGSLASLADTILKFDEFFRVTEKRDSAAGCGCGGGTGQGTKTIRYYDSPTPTTDPNQLKTTVVETRADGSTQTLHLNAAGQPIFTAVTDGATTWRTGVVRDASGRVVLEADPAAVSGAPDESRPDLGNAYSCGAYELFSSSAGQLASTEYYGGAGAATDLSPGGAPGFVKATAVANGGGGTPIPQSLTKYIRRTDGIGGSDVVYVPAETTRYRDTAGADPQTTSMAYQWTAAFRMTSVEVKRPNVTAGQNGPGGSARDTDFTGFDDWGNPTITVDALGRRTDRSFDLPTGGVTAEVVDANTGGLALATTTTVDPVGRPVRIVRPNGDDTRIVYNDAYNATTGAVREVRTYQGYNPATGTATSPTLVTREIRPAAGTGNAVYTESLVSTAAPSTFSSVGSYELTGAEAITGASVANLSRSYQNESGQVTKVDAYFSMSGLTGLTAAGLRAPDLGTASNDSAAGNYHRVTYAYSHVGRRNRATDATGTFTYEQQNALGWTTAVYTGTNATGFTHANPTNGGAGGNDLVQVAAYEYDNGGAGAGNRTRETVYPSGAGSPADARSTVRQFDWRNRQVVQKEGDQGGAAEAGDLQRPLNFYVYDNIGNVVQIDRYDGDQVVVAASGGEPVAPASSLRRARIVRRYDNQNREYQLSMYAVQAEGLSAGNVSGNALTTDTWFNGRGDVVKVRQPGGLVTKTAYDNARRIISVSTTDGGGDTSYADASTLAGDNVLDTTSYTLDRNGNATLTTRKERFHDETATGALGDAATSPKARVAYSVAAYDRSDRPVASVSAGAVGGTATGATSTTLVDAARTDGSGSFAGYTIVITGGSGSGQSRRVTAYDGTTDTFVIDSPWTTSPNTSSTYRLVPPAAGTGATTGATSTSLSDAARSETAADHFKDQWVLITSGTGSGQRRRVSGYNGATKTFTVATAWDAGRTPDTTSRYAVVPDGLVESFAYNEAGRLRWSADANATVTLTETDMLGREIKQVLAYTDGAPSAGDDQTTVTTYNGNDDVLTLTLDMPTGQADQVTQNVLGVKRAAQTIDGIAYPASLVASGSLLQAVRYPAASGGTPGTAAGDRKVYTYNAVGEVTTFKDRNQSEHAYTRDPLRRVVQDAVTLAVGSQVDGAVLRLETRYNTQGLPDQFTSYSASSGGTITSQVRRTYNSLMQRTDEYQAVSGAVDPVSTPVVHHNYSEMSGGANHSRLTSVVYPSGTVVSYDYSGTVNNTISRLSTLKLGGTAIEAYEYLGSSTIVERRLVDPGLSLTYIKPVGGANGPSGDPYAGIDRYGRVTDQRWRDVGDASTSADDRDADWAKHTYDAAGNRLTAEQQVGGAGTPGTTQFDRSYTYNKLYQLIKDNRGDLVSGTITDANAKYTQRWDGASGSGLDAAGNWTGVSTDADGGGAGAATNQTRTHNAQNQITTMTGTAANPAFDSAGNMTRDETDRRYKYNAWGETVEVATAAGATIVRYTVDPLGRIAAQDFGPGYAAGTDKQLFYSPNGQILEERRTSDGARVAENVWSPTGVNVMVMRETYDPSTAAGALDLSFSGDGKYSASVAAGVDAIRYVRQNDGKIVGAGVVAGHVGIVRFLPDGTLDNTFDGDGIKLISTGSSSQALGLAIQPNGAIVLSGVSDGNVLLLRVTDTGALDGSFGAGGKVSIDYGGTDQAFSLAVQSDGKIVFCGVSNTDLLLGRVDSSGVLDSTFDGPGATPGNGKFTVNVGGTDRALRMALDRDGNIVVTGDTTVNASGGSGGAMLVRRFKKSDGTNDAFGTSGQVLVDLSGSQDTGRDVFVDNDNNVFIAGYGDGDFDVVKLTPSGGFATFGVGGIQRVPINGTDQAESVAVDSRGRVVVGGSAESQRVFAVIRLNADGSLDTAFDADGKQTVDFNAPPSATTEIGYTMLVAPDDKIVIAGLNGADVAVARLGGGTSRSYALQGANWDITAVATSDGKVTERYWYSAYGTRSVLNDDFTPDADSAPDGPAVGPYGFQGMWADESTGNWNAQNRWLRPTLGRFTQPDPLGYQDGPNRYQFVRSNPVNRVDPNGMLSELSKLELEYLRTWTLVNLERAGDPAWTNSPGTLEQRAAYYCSMNLQGKRVQKVALDMALLIIKRGMEGVRIARFLLNDEGPKALDSIKAASEAKKWLDKHQQRMTDLEKMLQIRSWEFKTPDTSCCCTLTMAYDMRTGMFRGYIEGRVGDVVSRGGGTTCENSKPFFFKFSAIPTVTWERKAYFFGSWELANPNPQFEKTWTYPA